jgi:outer membrane biosynthesis protein TonB
MKTNNVNLSKVFLIAALTVAVPAGSAWATWRYQAEKAIAAAKAAESKATAAGATSAESAQLIKEAEGLLPSRQYTKARELARKAKELSESALKEAKTNPPAAPATGQAEASPAPAQTPTENKASTPPESAPKAKESAATAAEAAPTPTPTPTQKEASGAAAAAAKPTESATPPAQPSAQGPAGGSSAEAEKAIAAAELARKRAASIGGEWRDTGSIIKEAEQAAASGRYADAVKLADQAKRQGDLGYEQAIHGKNAGFPSYMK